MNRFFSHLPSSVTAKTEVEMLLLREYGSVFIASGGATPPPKIVFPDQAEVIEFQDCVEIRRALIGGFELELQAAAMEQLLAAKMEAESQKLTISPRGQDSARRDYDATVALWASRVEPALDHWVKEGRLKESAQ